MGQFTGDLWIGLEDESNEGQWRWIDGRKLRRESAMWRGGQPDGGQGVNCALISNDAMAYDARCADIHLPLCEKPL